MTQSLSNVSGPALDLGLHHCDLDAIESRLQEEVSQGYRRGLHEGVFIYKLRRDFALRVGSLTDALDHMLHEVERRLLCGH